MVEILKEPIALSILGGLLSMLVLYVNNKIRNEKNVQSEYFKLFGLVTIICFIVLQIFSHQDLNTIVNETMKTVSDASIGTFNNINMRGGHPDF